MLALVRCWLALRLQTILLLKLHDADAVADHASWRKCWMLVLRLAQRLDAGC